MLRHQTPPVFSFLLFNVCNKIPFIMISAVAAFLHHVCRPMIIAKVRHQFCLSSETI